MRVVSVACKDVVIVEHALDIGINLSGLQEPIDQDLIAENVHDRAIVKRFIDDVPLRRKIGKSGQGILHAVLDCLSQVVSRGGGALRASSVSYCVQTLGACCCDWARLRCVHAGQDRYSRPS